MNTPNELDCRTLQENLRRYLEGDAEPQVAAQVEQHLETCSACREVPIVEAPLATLLHQRLTPVPAPEALRRRIRHSLETASAAPETVTGTASSPAWYTRIFASPWAPRLAMAAVLLFLMAVPMRMLFRSPALAQGAVQRHEQHAGVVAGALPGCCKALDVVAGDRLGPPSSGAVVPDLTAAGLELQLATRCSYGGEDVTVLAYRSPRAVSFSLYITDHADEDFRATDTAQNGGVEAARHEIRDSEVTIWAKQGLVWFWVGPRANPTYTPALTALTGSQHP